MPTGADRVAATGVTGSNAPLRPARSRLWHRNWWRRRVVRLRHAMRRRPMRRSPSVRSLVTLIGGIIAIVLALAIPVGYGIIGYFKEGHALTYMAELSSARAAQYIYAPDAPWRYDTDQLAAISEIRTTTAAPIVQRILDKQGAVMMQKGNPLPWPTFARHAPIFAAGAMVGMAEVAASLRPLLAEVASVALGSLALAIAAYFAFARLPLGALNRTLDELKTANDKFKQQNLLLDTALGNMVQGLAMYDADARLVIANDQYSHLYNLDPASVKPGMSLREVVERRVAKGVYPGGNADELFVRMRELAAGKHVSHEANKLTDGRVIATSIQPRADGGWVVTHDDVTEREALAARLSAQNELLRRHDQELQAQNERFDAALKNMSHGLCMFDAEQRVMIANARYAEIYRLTAEQVQPGTTLRRIIECRIARGLYAGPNPEEYIKERLESFNEASVAVHQLSDGRSICVRRQPMREGGWVTTHEDISERETLNAQLEQQHQLVKQQEERLRQQNLQLDAALNNMVQGLAMFDADLRVVLANKRYAEIYGLTAERVRPGTPLLAIYQSRIAAGSCCGKTAEQMLKTMLARTAGQDDTQYISPLIDGRHIAVSVQRMADGGMVMTHQDITDQRRSEAKIVHMALHDALTDLPNRVLLNERLEHALTRVRRGDMLAVHLLDLDHFKTVNDTLGHPVGDKLLKMVAERLRALLRETDTIARMGGDEFAVLQMGIAQPADATVLALRIVETVSAPYDLEGTQVVIGTSVGIAVGPADGTSPDQLIRNADLALYRAKGDGRSTYRFFGPEMDAQMQVRRSMEHDLRKGLAAREFELHYQPVVNLASDEISGVEALIRWRHPEKGLIPPSTFIPVAEEIGFIIQLGEWAIREACRTARSWPDDIRIAVNLSPVQFRNPGFLAIVVSALSASGLSPDRLELEITEGMLLQDGEATLNTLYQLRALGVRIAMDDFGTGYSSLSYLQSFPFDKIKIDRSFVKDIADGVGSLNIVRAVAAMANGLGMTTTAEGVETQEQLDTVRAEGCTEMQGFLFSKPLPVDDIARLLLAARKVKAMDERADNAA
jgi:diguanylate cyclase (GGDEF)-like protein